MLQNLDCDPVESDNLADLQVENLDLKRELELVKSRTASLSKVVEIENQDPGFDLPSDWVYSQLNTVNFRLHDEILQFRAQIEQQMGEVDQLARQLCAKLRQLVVEIDPELDVGVA